MWAALELTTFILRAVPVPEHEHEMERPLPFTNSFHQTASQGILQAYSGDLQALIILVLSFQIESETLLLAVFKIAAVLTWDSFLAVLCPEFILWMLQPDGIVRWKWFTFFSIQVRAQSVGAMI